MLVSRIMMAQTPQNSWSELLISVSRWKNRRRPRLVIAFRIRRVDWPELSGRETLAAASSRLRCVLLDGCPVLSVHFSFGLAPHMGQRTDNICPNVSFSGFTPILF